MMSRNKCSHMGSRPGSIILTLIFIIGMISFYACSGGGAESTGGKPEAYSEAGAIRFSLDWRNAIAQGGAIRRPLDLVLNPDGTIDCEQSGITTIFAMVLGQDDELLKDNGNGWDCLEHKGNIKQVQAGTGRKLVVSGRDATGRDICKGETPADITVVPGETTGVIRVAMSPVPALWIKSTSPTDSAADVRIDSGIEIVFNLNVDPDTLAGTTVKANSQSFDYTTSYQSGSYTVTLDPTRDLPAESDVSIELPDTVTGYNNELFTGNRSFSFRTGTLWHNGNTVFVSPSGLAGNPGTKAEPLRSIQEAVDTAHRREFTQVYVQDGNYTHSNGGLSSSENVGLHISTPITVVGGWNATFTDYSISNSILDGESACDHVVHIQSSDVTLQYLTITGGNADGPEILQQYGGGLYIYNTVDQSNILIQDTEISGNTCEQDGGGVYVCPRSTRVTILDSEINNNSSLLGHGCGGLYTNSSDQLTVDNVDFRDNNGSGLHAFDTTHFTLTGSFFTGNGQQEAIQLNVTSNTVITSNYIVSDNVGIFLNCPSGHADPFPNLSITSCGFSSTEDNSTTATAVREGESDVHGHTFTHNRFYYLKLAILYVDWDGTAIPYGATGVGDLNTPNHPNHDANPATQNHFY